MVEVQQGLGHGSEDSPRKDLTTTDKLVLAHNARQDFARALSITDQLQESPSKAFSYIVIAREQAECGIDPSLPFSKALQLAQSGKEWVHPQQIYMDLARTKANIGSIDEALQLAELSTQGTMYTYLEIAKAQAKVSIGEGPVFARALEKAKGYMDYSAIAQAQHETGNPSKTMLDKALEDAHKHKSGYKVVAIAYAKCGYFNEALQTAEEIEDNGSSASSEWKKRTLSDIAREQVYQGKMQEGLETASKTGDKLLPAEIAANGAMRVALFGEENSSLVVLAKEYFNKALEAGDNEEFEDLLRVRQVKTVSLIAEAQWTNGDDQQETFSQAMRIAEEIIDPEQRGIAYLSIATHQMQSAMDNSKTLSLALDEADRMTTIEDPEMFADAFQEALWEDIAETAIKSRNYELVRKIVGKYDEDGYVRARTLAKLAKAETERGLTQRKINDLSQGEIQAIIAGDNELAKEAIVYFGLDKKVS